jgi:hypothetical protein
MCLQELQFIIRAVLVPQSSSQVQQLGKYGMIAGLVVVRTGVKIEVSAGRFTEYLMAQRTISSPVNICVQERNVAVSFSIHGELNILVNTLQVTKMSLNPSAPLGQMTIMPST